MKPEMRPAAHREAKEAHKFLPPLLQVPYNYNKELKMEEWQSLLKDYTTTQAFVLTISKTQAWMLFNIKRIQTDKAAMKLQVDCPFSIPAGKQLRNKGLVVSPDPKHQGMYELTPAGELVVQLLLMVKDTE